jgi:hypothetical protein
MPDLSERPGKYVRDHYLVPAFIGVRVTYTYEGERHGKITGFDGARLIVKFDDETRGSRSRLHPTWQITYDRTTVPDA